LVSGGMAVPGAIAGKFAATTGASSWEGGWLQAVPQRQTMAQDNAKIEAARRPKLKLLM
jgi:hypothetical protein